MSKTISIDLDEKLERSLEKEWRVSGRQSEELPEIITDMLQRFLFLASLNRAQDALAGKAEEAGFLSEEDVFRKIS